ncbi:discoidin domain-containing receptor A-like [Amphiura filiformis]|uniref:discoidin domain-containing receptor A-like n=1 Tax=Amphiura filiformis TaxID=82378 RepID=UPI003B227607
MSDRRIPNNQLAASSVYGDDPLTYGPQNARLNLNLGGGAWCPDSVRPESTGGYEYLEISLLNMTMVTAVSMQGRWDYGLGREYVRKFRLEYTTNGGSWSRYADQNLETVFDGNSDTQTIKTVDLSPAIIATKLRIVPVVEKVTTECMRIELFGCLWQVEQACECSGEQACEDSYTGETAQPLHNRMVQHRRASSGGNDSAVFYI